MFLGLADQDIFILGMTILVFVLAFYGLKTIQDKNELKNLKGEKKTEARFKKDETTGEPLRVFSPLNKTTLDRILGLFLIESTVEWRDKYNTRFEQAGYSTANAPALYIMIKILFILVFIAGYLMALVYFPPIERQDPLVKSLFLIVAIIVGFRAFDYYLDFRTLKRYNLIKRDLTSALDLLAICTNAGLSLERGFDQVAEEVGIFNPELGKELAITAAELSILPDRRQALSNLRQRVNMPLMNGMVTTLIQSEEQGTSISDTLRILSISFTKEKVLEIETKAARLPAILTVPLVLLILPSLFVVILGPGIIQILNQFKF